MLRNSTNESISSWSCVSQHSSTLSFATEIAAVQPFLFPPSSWWLRSGYPNVTSPVHSDLLLIVVARWWQAKQLALYLLFKLPSFFLSDLLFLGYGEGGGGWIMPRRWFWVRSSAGKGTRWLDPNFDDRCRMEFHPSGNAEELGESYRDFCDRCTVGGWVK